MAFNITIREGPVSTYKGLIASITSFGKQKKSHTK